MKTQIKSTTAETASPLYRRLFGLAQIAGLSLAIYLAGRALIAFLAPESLWQAPKTALPAANTQPAAISVKLNVNYDPFYQNRKAQDIIEVGTDAPETTLNLKLAGLRAGENGSAILQTANGTQKRYNVGEEIMNGVTLKAVKPDHVVISQSGRVERLTMARRGEGFLNRDEMADANTRGGRAKTASVIKTHKNTATSNLSSRTAQGRQNVISLSGLMNEVTLTRLGKAGAVRGYRILPKNGSNALTQLGLVPGDILTQVGAVDLTSPSFNPSQLALMLSNRKTVDVNLIRGQKAVSVTVGK